MSGDMNEFSGRVMTGRGEGAHYVALYNPYFRIVLGREFFPGTLNLKVDGFDASRFSDRLTAVIPAGKNLFPVDCAQVRIGPVDGYLIIPRKTSHPNTVVELVSAVNIRERLSLQDGDVLTFAIL